MSGVVSVILEPMDETAPDYVTIDNSYEDLRNVPNNPSVYQDLIAENPPAVSNSPRPNKVCTLT